MEAADLSRADWRKSSYSAQNGNCAEVGTVGQTIFMRDTEDRDGVILSVPAGAWQAFTATLSR